MFALSLGLEGMRAEVQKMRFGAKKFFVCLGNAAGLSALWIVGTETHGRAEVFLEVDDDEGSFEGFV